MANKTFKEKLLFSGRKLLISIKRNYYIIPLIFVCVCCAQFMCILHKISKSFERVSSEFGAYSCMFVFLIALLLILACVAYLNYALTKYGQKRPLHMLIIYFVMAAAIVAMLIYIYRANQLNLIDEINLYNQAAANKDQASQNTYLDYINKGLVTKKLLTVQFVLLGVSVALVATAPLVQEALSKLKFRRIEDNGENK
jgi:hypothetical protein